MFIKILMNYIIGYVNIHIEGYFIERFINICRSKSILLWNMTRTSSSVLSANIGIQDFKKIKQITKKTKCRVHIENKKGVPFLFHRYKKRKLFFILLIFVCVSLVVTSNFVWNIEILGNTEIEIGDILSDLEENGLGVGTYKGKIDTKQIINNIRLKRNDLAWIGIHLEGTNARVEIVEADKKPDIIDDTEFCNIVSDKEGVIVKCDAQNGTALVKQGDVVKKGTVLIGGWIEGKYTGTRYVHALGDTLAKVWYSEKIRIDLNEEIYVRTGAVEKKYGININNFVINFYKTLSKFENYDTINENKKIKLFSNFYLPIEILKSTNYETISKQITYGKEKAITLGQTKAIELVEQKIEDKDNIVGTKVNTYEYEDYVEVEVIYEVLEMIGTNEKIVF